MDLYDLMMLCRRYPDLAGLAVVVVIAVIYGVACKLLDDEPEDE